MKLNIKLILFSLVFISILYFPLFYRLGSDHVKMWDEARYAVNAIEMQNNKNILINTFDNKPDWWNSKPPIGAYIQSISFRIFGINELGLRFPSAFFTLLSVVVLILFSKKVLKNIIPGIISSLVLISCSGIIQYHVSRTGDYDSFFVFFILVYSLLYFKILLDDNIKNKNKHFFLILLFLLLAFFTKGIASLIPIPGLLLCTLISKKTKFIFTSWQLYISALIFLILVLSYYFIREQYDKGYINAVLKQELGIFSKESGGKNREFLFYFKSILNKNFYPFAFFIPFSIISFYFTNNIIYKKTIIFSTIFSLLFITIHSLSKTGNEWYDAPVYPFLSILFSLSIFIYYEKYVENLQNKLLKYIILIFVLLIIIFPYKNIIKTVKKKDYPVYHLELEGAFMKKLYKEKNNCKNYTVTYKSINLDQVKFYQHSLNNKGYNIQLKSENIFNINDTILSCQEVNMNEIKNKYHFTILESWDNCNLLKIDSLKQK